MILKVTDEMISKTGFWIALLLCILFSILFVVFPQIDIQVSSIFFSHGYFLKQKWMTIIRTMELWTIYCLIIISVLIIIWNIFRKKYQMIKPALYLLLCFSLGPGLLVNVILKDHWGRPRPVQITQFGGNKIFQKAWVINRQCATNCSFVAGEPSAAFAFFAFLALLKKKRTWQWPVASFLTFNWLLISYIRIAEGGHFLSDVLIGATLTYMVIWICYYLIYEFNYRFHN
jgi:lipid A 4'-phosphatase